MLEGIWQRISAAFLSPCRQLPQVSLITVYNLQHSTLRWGGCGQVPEVDFDT
jgi:hypothetical protein